MAMQPARFGFGQSVLRKEDDPLLRGRGRYIGDVAPRDTLHAVVLRSPHAHARFHIDAAKARAMPGVHLVLTGAETDDLGPLPCTVELRNTVLDVPPYASPDAGRGAPCRAQPVPDGRETLRLFPAEFLYAGLGLRPGRLSTAKRAPRP